MIVKFGLVSAIAAITIFSGLQPADARGAMPTLHDAWSGAHAEVLPATYAQARQSVAPRRPLVPRRPPADAYGSARGM